MTTLTFDSYAWIAFFGGKSKMVKDIVESNAIILTPSVVITEIKHKYEASGHDPKTRLKFIEERSAIVDITKQIASKAAEFKLRYKLYSIDALIYATALSKNTKLVSGDEHFKKIPEIVFIKE
jgi:predicted nucleic acid-binding protein